jgi:PAS domain S-box-containing protein
VSPLPIYHLRSLRIVVPVILLLFAAVAGGASYYLLWRISCDQYEREAWDNAVVRTTELQSRIETWMQRRDPQMVQSALSAQTMRIETTAALLLDPAGTVIAASSRELVGRPFEIATLGLAPGDATALQAAMSSVRETRRSVQIFTADRNHLLTCHPSAQPLQPGELIVRRDGLILTVYDLRFAKGGALRRLQAEFGILAGGILVLALGLGASLHFLVTRRLDDLQAAMKGFAAGQAIEEMKPRLNDEITQLKGQFNDMARNIGREILERRQAEARLRESEASLRSLSDNLPNGMVYQVVREADGKTRYLYVSAGVERLYGVTPEMAVRDISLLHRQMLPEDLPLIAAAAEESARTMGIFNVVVRRRRPDGEIRWMQLCSAPRQQAGGQVVWDGVQLDITEQRQAEQLLREHEAKLTLAMGMAQLAHWEYDVDNGMFTFDASFYALLRTTPEREGGVLMAPQVYADKFLPKDESASVAREIAQAIATTDRNYTRRLEHAIIRADGSEGVFLVQFMIRKDAAGRTVKFYGVNQDITDRVQAERQRTELERQLRQVQKMDAVGTLAGGIAHDFNNILTAIISFTELSRMDAEGQPSLQANLNEVLRAANRASQLVQQILSFSRRTPQERRIAPMAPLVREALKLLRSTLPSTIRFEEHFETDLPHVMVDATQIHQVVMNLCTNAGHAMRGRQGRLIVRLESWQVAEPTVIFGTELRPGDYLRLAVSDTGTGMPEATLQRIFEPFFTTKETGEGTGLGLAVVHSIVKGHDGAITVESQVGRGSTFCIYLPAVARAAAVAPEAVPDVPQGRNERILFVDDESVICSAAQRLLAHHGFRPTVFVSAEAAWGAFAAAPHDYDVVVTDLTMPSLTGVDLAGRMRNLRPEMPVIMTSGFSGALKQDSLHLVGVRELVQKPIDFRLLTMAIHRALNGRTAQ